MGRLATATSHGLHKLATQTSLTGTRAPCFKLHAMSNDIRIGNANRNCTCARISNANASYMG